MLFLAPENQALPSKLMTGNQDKFNAPSPFLTSDFCSMSDWARQPEGPTFVHMKLQTSRAQSASFLCECTWRQQHLSTGTGLQLNIFFRQALLSSTMRLPIISWEEVSKQQKKELNKRQQRSWLLFLTAQNLWDTPGGSTLPEEKHSCLHTLQVAWLFLYSNHTSPLLVSARILTMACIAHSLMQQTAQQLDREAACFVSLIWETKAYLKPRWLGNHTSLTPSEKEEKREKHPLVTADNFLFPWSALSAQLTSCPLSTPADKERKLYCLLFRS